MAEKCEFSFDNITIKFSFDIELLKNANMNTVIPQSQIQ